MLYNRKGEQVNIPAHKELSDGQRRALREKLEFLPHKGHQMFRMDPRCKLSLV